MEYYSADFETTNHIMNDSGLIEVWLAGACNVRTNEIEIITESLDSFMDWVFSRPSDTVVYFHNLKHDGEFILSWLERNGFAFVESDREMKRSKEYTCLISDGAFYDIVLRTTAKHGGHPHKVYVYDSLKRLPFSLDKLTKDYKVEHGKLTGTIDYNRHNERCEVTPEELEYFRHDLLGLAEVIKAGILYNGELDAKDRRTRPKMTIGSEALRYYKKGTNETWHEAFSHLFPPLPADITEWCRRGYFGGWCYVNPKYQNKTLGRGVTADVNSLYPSMMYEPLNLYPTGEIAIIEENPEHVINLMEQTNAGKHPTYAGKQYVFFYEFDITFELKPEHLPCIQVHKDPRFYAREWLKSSHGEYVNMVRTEMDLRLICEQYDVSIRPRKAVGFYARSGIFSSYIDHWIQVKKNPKSPSEKSIAKNYLNSLYGKFATKTVGLRYRPNGFDENGKLILTPEADERKALYMPVGAFIPSYARCFTIRHAQANYDRFCYADTDSLHMLGGVEDVKMCKIHDKELSCWKIEMVWDSAKFIRPKTYVETANGENDIKCCGLSKEKQLEIAESMESVDLVENYLEILRNVPDGKLLRKRGAGGVALVPTEFKLRGDY